MQAGLGQKALEILGEVFQNKEEALATKERCSTRRGYYAARAKNHGAEARKRNRKSKAEFAKRNQGHGAKTKRCRVETH